jgi:hypothetical protein
MIFQVRSILDTISVDWNKTVEETAESLLKKIGETPEKTPEKAPETSEEDEESDQSQDLFNTAFVEEDTQPKFGLRARFMTKIKASQRDSQPDIKKEIEAWRNYDFNMYKDW